MINKNVYLGCVKCNALNELYEQLGKGKMC